MFEKLGVESTLFAKSDLKWHHKRRVLSAAMYKDKLRDMVESMKYASVNAIRKEWMQRETLDVVKETSNIYMQIILACLFGKE